MTEPLVDIGIPVYRRADYIGTAIESVLAQSYGEWRLTISEDAGPTAAVRNSVAPYLVDERVRYVTPDERLGLARNKSSLATPGQGKYMALLDDDDRWMPEWLERRVDFLERQPECVLVWGGHIDIDPTGVELARSAFPLAGGVHSSREFVQVMMPGNVVATPSVLLRREAYVRAGNAFDASFVYINDYELWLRMGMLGPVGFLAVHDSAYRVHPAQLSLQRDQALDHLHLIDHLDELLRRADIDLRLPPAARRRQKADRFLSAALDAAEQGDTRIAARRIRSAAGLDPRALASTRGLSAIAATVGGRTVSRRIGALRSR
jgi:glycosyltransferase involved in cell wall biosynthesis